MAIEEKDHPRIERLYRARDLTVVEIAKLYDVHASTVDGLRKRLGWPGRAERPKAASQAVAPAAECQHGPEPESEQKQEPPAAPKPAKRRAPTGNYATLLKRNKAILEKQIAEVENILDAIEGSDTGRTAADRERDARALSSLTRTLEKLRELELADKAARAGARKKGDQRSIEDIRKDLEQRISRIAAAKKKK